MLALQTILHPTDFSQPSDSAFRLACSLARDHGATVVLLHVVHHPVAFGGDLGPILVTGEDREFLLDRLEGMKPLCAPVRIEVRLEEGDPATQIIDAAEELDCDLIVMGTHGRTGLGRLLMGSVAEQVMRNAPCPVLTIKSPLPVKSALLRQVLAGATQS